MLLALGMLLLTSCRGDKKPKATGTSSQTRAPSAAPASKFIVSPPCPARSIRGLMYAGFSERQKLDLYLPLPSTKGRRPLVIWVHGGGWAGGSRVSVERWALRQVCRGYAVASVGYRFSWEAPFRAQLVDLKNAVRYLKMYAWKYRLDPYRFAVWGASAGGHLAALVATTGHFPDANLTELDRFSARVSAVIDWWGPSDLGAMPRRWPRYCKSHRDPTAPDSAESRLLGCPLRQCPDAARAASPITYVHSRVPPFLLMAGERDCTVPARQSLILRDALAKKGVEVEYVMVKGAGHGDGRWSQRDVERRVDTFLDRHLGRHTRYFARPRAKKKSKESS